MSLRRFNNRNLLKQWNFRLHGVEDEFGGETVGVAAAIAFQQAVAFELAQVVAEMVQPELFGGELERSEDGFVDLFGRRAADGVAGMQQDFEQANGSRVMDV